MREIGVNWAFVAYLFNPVLFFFFLKKKKKTPPPPPNFIRRERKVISLMVRR